jgi:hypothetical protein
LCQFRTFNHLHLDQAVIRPSAAGSQRLGRPTLKRPPRVYSWAGIGVFDQHG